MGRTATRGGNVADTIMRTPGSVACYLRVSTDEQALGGLGIGGQRDRCVAMATVKGWPSPVVYADEGISGTKGVAHRPALARLLEDVRSGIIGAVILSELSRLGRQTRLVLELVEELSAAGAVLISCNESLDTSTPTGMFVLTMFAALAQLERDNIAIRTRASLRHLRTTKGVTPGKLPHGYHLAPDGSVAIEPVAAAAVIRIFALKRRGLSLREIAAKLQADGHPSPRGGAWSHTTVAGIVQHAPIYRGGRRAESAFSWPRLLPVERRGDPKLHAADDAALEAVHA